MKKKIARRWKEALLILTKKITLYHVKHTDLKLNSVTKKNDSRCEQTTATRFILTSPTSTNQFNIYRWIEIYFCDVRNAKQVIIISDSARHPRGVKSRVRSNSEREEPQPIGSCHVSTLKLFLLDT